MIKEKILNSMQKALKSSPPSNNYTHSDFQSYKGPSDAYLHPRNWGTRGQSVQDDHNDSKPFLRVTG